MSGLAELPGLEVISEQLARAIAVIRAELARQDASVAVAQPAWRVSVWASASRNTTTTAVLQGSTGCRTTWRQKLHGELLQHVSRGVVLVVAAGLTLAVSAHGAWRNTCGVTTSC